MGNVMLSSVFMAASPSGNTICHEADVCPENAEDR